jgi:uncharacterized protein
MTAHSIINIALNRDFTHVKNSEIHGKGMFAKRNIPKGSRVIEYKGDRVLKKDLIKDMLDDKTSLMYVMNLSETVAIDGERNGNDARFINHSCEPNCTVYYFSETPFIYALRDILLGEELNFDYQLGTDDQETEYTLERKQELFPCKCGAKKCRGTLLSI